jgi:hypothetical protein
LVVLIFFQHATNSYGDPVAAGSPYHESAQRRTVRHNKNFVNLLWLIAVVGWLVD